MINYLSIFILGAFLPILLWPIEYILPFPHIVEEVAKLLALLFIAKNKINLKSLEIKHALLFAISFTLSESMLYIMNLFMINQLHLFPKRILLTGLLHISTILILFSSLKKKTAWKVVALTLSIFLHYTYNDFIDIIF